METEHQPLVPLLKLDKQMDESVDYLGNLNKKGALSCFFAQNVNLIPQKVVQRASVNPKGVVQWRLQEFCIFSSLTLH